MSIINVFDIAVVGAAGASACAGCDASIRNAGESVAQPARPIAVTASSVSLIMYSLSTGSQVFIRMRAGRLARARTRRTEEPTNHVLEEQRSARRVLAER